MQGRVLVPASLQFTIAGKYVQSPVGRYVNKYSQSVVSDLDKF